MNNHLLYNKKKTFVALKLFSYNFFINHATTTVIFVHLIILTTISMVVVNIIQGIPWHAQKSIKQQLLHNYHQCNTPKNVMS